MRISPDGTMTSDFFHGFVFSWLIQDDTYIVIYGDEIWMDAPLYIFFNELGLV